MKLKVGDSVTVYRQYSQADFDRFAQLSGDDNPIHVDPLFAAGTHFGQTVCHGMLLYSSICSVMSSQLPGPDVHQLGQELMFSAPTFANEKVAIQISILEILNADNLVRLSTNIVRSDGSYSCQGTALITMNSNTLPRGKEIESSKPMSDSDSMKGLFIGQQASVERTFSTNDMEEYRKVTFDNNPIFFNMQAAEGLGLRKPIVPGGLLGAMFSYLLGMVLPGPGTNWLKQKLDFWSPAYLGESLTAVVEIVRLRPEKDLVNLRTSVWNSEEALVCSGESLVLVRELQVAL